jgi:hypothetical protein
VSIGTQFLSCNAEAKRHKPEDSDGGPAKHGVNCWSQPAMIGDVLDMVAKCPCDQGAKSKREARQRYQQS